ncbi:MAG: R.Pab1 family restriction endonuclease [Canidatus Methanoxibalbensis ujae]|nr:R.Pab1 family restriction endonuclease [Candidatus Methanoxibalbensis ujae]
MNIPAKIEVGKGKLIVKLPLTNPTGKIRVKRRGKTSNYGIPIATRKEVFKEIDYVEWQISYATDNPPVESKVEDIKLNGQVGFELTKLLCEGIKIGILSNNDIREMETFIKDIKKEDTLEENEEILREGTKYEVKGGFQKFIEKSPLFIKNNAEKGYFVEIILKHKQRAVGLQAMVYLCIYINQLKDGGGKLLMGRTARPREFGILEITSENKEIIIDIVKAFAIASCQHRNDIQSILQQVVSKCRK